MAAKAIPRLSVRVATLLLVAGCGHFSDFIATLPPEVLEQAQHDVAPEAVAIAESTQCDAQPGTLAELEAALPPIVETKATRGRLLALPLVCLVPKGFDEQPEADRVRRLQHEARHYCQRRTVPCFDQLWLHGHCDNPKALPRSDYRAAFETAAYQGDVPDDFTSTYALHDIRPASLAKLVDTARR